MQDDVWCARWCSNDVSFNIIKSMLLPDPSLKRTKWAGHSTLVESRFWTSSMSALSRVTQKVVSEHEAVHLSNMHPAHRSLRVGNVDLAINEHKRLQAFHMRCQRRILGVVWRDKVRTRRWRRQRVYHSLHRSATSSAYVELHSSVMWWGSEKRRPHTVPSDLQLTPVPDVQNPHPGDGLVVDAKTHGWSLWCSWVHPSSCSGTVLCSMDMVTSDRNVSRKTRDCDRFDFDPLLLMTNFISFLVKIVGL